MDKFSGVEANNAVLEFAKARAARGFGTGDVPGLCMKASDRACRRLLKSGLIFKVTISHKNIVYFGEQKWADKAALGISPRTAMPATVTTKRNRALWAPPPKGVITPVEGITKATKFVVGPTPPLNVFRTNTHAL